MDTYSEIINEFNSTFSTNASLCEDLKVGWDLGDCRSFALYQLVEDQRSAPFGTVLYNHIGSYNTGEVYEAEGTAGFSLCSRLDSIENFFPLSSNKATRNLEIGYRSTWLGGVVHFPLFHLSGGGLIHLKHCVQMFLPRLSWLTHS